MNVRNRTLIIWTASLLLALALVTPVAAQEPGVERRAPRPETRQDLVTAQPAAGRADGAYIAPVAPADSSESPDPADVEPPRPITVKIEGTVTEVNTTVPGNLYVDGLAILVTDGVDYIPDRYRPELGDHVLISAVRDGSTWTATIIQSGLMDNPTEFRGIIQSHPSSSADYVGRWMIGGVAVDVVSRSDVTNTPVVGYYAQVEGWLGENRSLRATHVTVLDPQAEASAFEFEGIIQETTATTPGTWRIGGYEGTVTAGTAIVGIPRVGSSAQVQGHVSDNGERIYDLIQVRDVAKEIRIVGIIEEMHGDYWVVDDQDIEILVTTFIDESRARAAVGMEAQIVARQGALAGIEALRIRIERP